MTNLTRILLTCSIVAWIGLGGCNKSGGNDTAPDQTDDHADDKETGGGGDDHDHGEEVSLGTAKVGDFMVECAQGHGTIEAGKELHLVVKLPYSDSGASVVRAWIGTEDRTMSIVGKGDYAASHDDYDLHADAPDPLPANPMWWIEVEKPDGTKHLGSIAPK